jgi:hypothetical protein
MWLAHLGWQIIFTEQKTSQQKIILFLNKAWTIDFNLESWEWLDGSILLNYNSKKGCEELKPTYAL